MIHLPAYVIQFMDRFRETDAEIYLVGGGVRDLLMGKDTKNWDFTTSIPPETIMEMFPDAFLNNSFGTVGIPIEIEDETLIFEVTPYRTEGVYRNNRHPESVSWAETLDEDLGRRDFTMNAIATDGTTIIDPFNGRADIQAKIIRAVGDPDIRFQEDALRLMRAVRFTAQLGFAIEEQTHAAVTRNADRIETISVERVRDELLRLISSDHPAEGVLFLRQTGILKHILPELDVCFSVDQKSPFRHHIYDVGTHLVQSLKHCPSDDPITRLATLLHDIGKPETYAKDPETQIITFYNHEVVGAAMTRRIAKRLHLSKKQSEKLVLLVANHQFTVSELQTDKAVRRFIRKIGKDNIDAMLALRTGDRIGSGARPTSWRFDLFRKRLEEVQHQPFTVKELAISGHDVMQIGNLPPSREIGDILDQIFLAVSENGLENTREVLLQRLDEILASREKTKSS